MWEGGHRGPHDNRGGDQENAMRGVISNPHQLSVGFRSFFNFDAHTSTLSSTSILAIDFMAFTISS